MNKLLSWREIPIAASITTPGSSLANKTGSWRTFKPVIDKNKCIKCFICWAFCPEAAVKPETFDINYDYCKGCGICAEECPVKAIKMISER